MVQNVSKFPTKSILEQVCPILDPSSMANVPLHQVFQFVKIAIERIIPLSLFGSKDNLSLYLKGLKDFLNMQKYESMTLGYMMHGIKVFILI
jgi:hypothetical protein